MPPLGVGVAHSRGRLDVPCKVVQRGVAWEGVCVCVCVWQLASVVFGTLALAGCLPACKKVVAEGSQRVGDRRGWGCCLGCGGCVGHLGGWRVSHYVNWRGMNDSCDRRNNAATTTAKRCGGAFPFA